MRLAGRRILLTGAASGIGRAAAETCRREGARLALLDVDPAVEDVARELDALALVLDLRDLAALPGAVDRAAGAMGGLDGVVNCAGAAVTRPLSEVTPGDWAKAMEINLTAPFLICQAAAPRLPRGGSIVNVVSGVGLRPDTPGVTPYAASKGGLIALTRALAAELAPDIRVNAVAPGLTRTPMTEHMLLGDSPPALARYAMKRAAEPEEIANAILFLLSDEASFVTGVLLAADGGRTFH
jgi:NAD(P)-dependent dehydrogenase (short-subunit alcohol dehydrogenase family)